MCLSLESSIAVIIDTLAYSFSYGRNGTFKTSRWNIGQSLSWNLRMEMMVSKYKRAKILDTSSPKKHKIQKDKQPDGKKGSG